ncbi:MAG: glucokinase [Thermoleophilaceae bacterium]|nr:glucokinase [Thermoleophilaceae bacterium]
MGRRRVIGIDAGGTKLLGGVVDDDLTVHARVHRLWPSGDRRAVLDTMVDAVEEARAAAPDIEAVGFGIPALVDREGSVSMWSTHLPLDDLEFRSLMSERLGLPVTLDNDANCALLAEHERGAARAAEHALLLTLGTGIGGSVMVDGRIYRGATGSAGELGHVVVDLDGPPCLGACPNRGCLEVMASGTAIGRAGVEAGTRSPESALGRALSAGRPVTGALVTEVAHDGDRVATEVLEEVGRRLGVGLASLANAFDPEVIVVGGGAIGADELLLEPARAELRARALPPPRDSVRVVRAYYGEEAGMIGAAMLALKGARR